jgi:hypothetical protein
MWNRERFFGQPLLRQFGRRKFALWAHLGPLAVPFHSLLSGAKRTVTESTVWGRPENDNRSL